MWYIYHSYVHYLTQWRIQKEKLPRMADELAGGGGHPLGFATVLIIYVIVKEKSKQKSFQLVEYTID